MGILELNPSKQKQLNRILQKYDGVITGANDLLAGQPPSTLFWLLADKLSYLMDPDPEKSISHKGVLRRRRLNFLICKLGAHFLSTPQQFENRNFLRDPLSSSVAPDPGIVLPKEPVIWVANHRFKDDALASILAARRHAYILFGSLPQFYCTFDGITAYLNGVAMCNRKVALSRNSSIAKAVRAMRFGADLLIFPEGVWNKTPSNLLLHFWPGIYRIACETGAKIVPIVHYIRDATCQEANNPIHTVIDDPIQIDDLSQEVALNRLRDVMATWYWLMMEAYGQSSHAALRKGMSQTAAWELELSQRLKTVDRYDEEIELHADYRPKSIVRPESVWQSIAEIDHITYQNAAQVAHSVGLVAELHRQDFQRRF